jgi:hypothetical protein
MTAGLTEAEEARPLSADLPWLLALFAAALWASVRTMGASPTVWEDTLIENLAIDDCLLQDRCTGVGVGATVGIFHSAGYLHWRAMLEWLGIGADGTHLALLLLNAVAVVLVGLAARRLGGRVAAGIAAVLMATSTGVATQLHVISDLAPVASLGAIFLALGLAATERPSLRATALLGLVAGVMANVYATGLLCGVSAVWIALLLPERRWTHAGVAALAVAVATLGISPDTWTVDAALVLRQLSHGTVGNGHTLNSRALFELWPARLLGLSVLAWAAAAATGSPLRRKLDVPAAMALPLFIPLALGSFTGRLDPQPKYCASAMGAVAVSLAVGAVALGDLLARRVERLRPSARAAAARFAPYLAAAAIAAGGLSPGRRRFPTFTYQDLASAQRVLVRDRGWTFSRAARNLRTLDENVRRAAIRSVPAWPDASEEGDLERAYLLKVPAPMVPRPLPDGVLTATATGAAETLVALTCSWIDWRSFRVCVRDEGAADGPCQESGLPAKRDGHADFGVSVPGMPVIDSMHPPRQTMTLHLPLQPRPECPEAWIYMPRLPRLCPGRVVGVTGGAAEIEDEGRRARLRLGDPAAGGSPTELVIAFELGGPGCWTEYKGYPPFFLEGSPATVALVSSLLERQATGPGQGP